MSTPLSKHKTTWCTNVKIIELLKNPTISSLSLAKKLDVQFSTLQKRRAKIEKAILKNYTFNYKVFGARVGDLIVNVDKGRSDEVARSIRIMLRIVIPESI